MATKEDRRLTGLSIVHFVKALRVKANPYHSGSEELTLKKSSSLRRTTIMPYLQSGRSMIRLHPWNNESFPWIICRCHVERIVRSWSAASNKILIASLWFEPTVCSTDGERPSWLSIQIVCKIWVLMLLIQPNSPEKHLPLISLRFLLRFFR